MSIYSAIGTQATAAKTALTIISTATIRPRITEVIYSNTGAVSSDTPFEVRAQRFTAAGTTTAVTPAPVDSGDPASTFTAGSNASAEPTYTANAILDDNGYNPRATFRWVAYDQRAEWILPATAANGVGFLYVAASGAATVSVKALVLQ